MQDIPGAETRHDKTTDRCHMTCCLATTNNGCRTQTSVVVDCNCGLKCIAVVQARTTLCTCIYCVTVSVWLPEVLFKTFGHVL